MLLVLACTAQAQWKKVESLRTDVATADTIYEASFAASFGYISSAETFRGARFYGGIINVIQRIDDMSYLNLWSTLPGTNQEDQSLGLSYNRQLAVPIQNLVLDWSVGVMALIPRDTLDKQWIGVPFGVRANYNFTELISIYGVFDAVPAFNVNRNNPSTSNDVGITFLGAAGITITP
jgi:hypothetical protein